jgi:hypothetical protein
MRGFWLPIGLRAAAIFVLGMLVYAGGRYLKHHTHFDAIDAHGDAVEVAVAQAQAAQSAAEAEVNAARATERAIAASVSADRNARLAEKLSRLGALQNLSGVVRSKVRPPDFVLDGRKVGSLVRFQGSRATPDARADLSVVVQMVPGIRATPCDIVPVEPDNFDLQKGFRCVVTGEPGLEKVGAVRFQPDGGTRAILASKATAAELAKGEPFAIDADLTGPMQLTVNGEDGERVQLKSDSQNTALVVHDGAGNAVVRMQAGKNGFSITVDTTGR